MDKKPRKKVKADRTIDPKSIPATFSSKTGDNAGYGFSMPGQKPKPQDNRAPGSIFE
jgi:hypothetical protein